MRLISCMLFSKCAGTCLSNGLSVPADSQDRRVVGPFVLETSGLILMPWSSLWVLMRW